LLICCYNPQVFAQTTTRCTDKKGKASVIFIRTAHQYSSAVLFNVIVNDSATIKMVNNSYYQILLSPATLEIRHNKSRVNVTYDIEAGKFYYVREANIPVIWKVRLELIVIDATSRKSFMSIYSPKD